MQVITSSRKGRGYGAVTPRLPALPQNLPVPHQWPLAWTRIVKVATSAELQDAVNTAEVGDGIVLANDAVFKDRKILVPNRGGGPGRFTIMTQSVYDGIAPFMHGHMVGDDRNIPGRTVNGQLGVDFGLPDDRPYMAQLQAPDTDLVLEFQNGAAYWTIAGLDIALVPTQPFSYNLVGCSTIRTANARPHHIQFWWCYVHGSDSQDINCGMRLNMTDAVTINCEIDRIFTNLAGAHPNGDVQALSWMMTERFLGYQCRYSCAGEIFMSGGADPNAITYQSYELLPGNWLLIPEDIEFDRCHWYKNPDWFDPTVIKACKNLWELKDVVRLRIRRCLFENTGVNAQAQAIVMQSASQNGTANWATNRDVTFEYNWIRNAPVGWGWGSRVRALYGRIPYVPAERFLMQHNIFENIGVDPYSSSPAQYAMSIVNGDSRDITVRFNTFIGATRALNSWLTLGNGSLDVAYPSTQGAQGWGQRWQFTDNIADLGQYFVVESNHIANVTTLLRNFVFQRRAQYGWGSAGTPEQWSGAAMMPPFPVPINAGGHQVDEITGIGFTDYANHNFRLLGSSSGKGIGFNGADPGANQDAIEAGLRSLPL